MNVAAGVPLMTESEAQRIHDAALHIMHEVGLLVEDPQVRVGLAELGGEVAGETVRFPPEAVEELIDSSEAHDPPQATPTVRSVAGVSVGRVLDPDTWRYEPWTEPAFADYVKLAHHL
ncbi:MAG: trimethylamine methyltransferase family protein, partial [Armatimonadota bacterium]